MAPPKKRPSKSPAPATTLPAKREKKEKEVSDGSADSDSSGPTDVRSLLKYNNNGCNIWGLRYTFLSLAQPDSCRPESCSLTKSGWWRIIIGHHHQWISIHRWWRFTCLAIGCTTIDKSVRFQRQTLRQHSWILRKRWKKIARQKRNIFVGGTMAYFGLLCCRHYGSIKQLIFVSQCEIHNQL